MCVVGKSSSKGVKSGLLGVKRKMEAIVGKEAEGPEPSETCLNETSAVPATTETSARCKHERDKCVVKA